MNNPELLGASVPVVIPVMKEKTVGDNGSDERKKKDFFFLSFPFPAAGLGARCGAPSSN
jgi:hypothetical protein